ncbi:MAG: hypothetical protein BroJett013_07020 [Alphaproteobacteria bacterium]|nr:MAG: hypothetical protein BroJett013_07020 [Alphaproteobacteria bacterium]
MSDPVNNPKHYNSHPGGMECIELVEMLPFCEGNAIKYLWRAGLKGSTVEDLRKALWYVDRAQSSQNALELHYSDTLRRTIQRAIDGFPNDRKGLAIRAVALRTYNAARAHIRAMIEEAEPKDAKKEEAA